ncbi:TetR/AcrR family transcriptional regulator [Actinoplanes sp. CA-054009]
MSVDVRVQRTRTRLREAVVRLAADRPVEDVPVADLVRAARVNRTTFYQHATSPAAVLSELLYEDLDAMRADLIAGFAEAALPPRAIWERSAAAMADHLTRFDALYTAGLVGHRSATLYRLLVDHFATTATTFLEQNPTLLPPGAGTPSWRTRTHGAFLAHGTAGVVEAWLSQPPPRDPALFVTAAVEVLPPWVLSR